MFVVDPYQPKLNIPDPFNLTTGYYECQFNNNGGLIIVYILVAFKLFLLLSGIIITFLIRKVKYIHLNESKWIAYSTYNLFISAVVVIILQLALDDRDLLFILRSLFIIFPIITTNLLLYLPKFYFFFRGKDTKQRTKHSTTKSSLDNSTSKSKSANTTQMNEDFNQQRRKIETEFRVEKT